jgi:hypothetical protein
MSLALIEAEVRRFLASKDPEVLCIKGKWGVGKTYAWKKFLREARKARTLGFEAYSYVSLFGLNSLADLRYSIFESTVSGDAIIDGPSAETASARFDKGKGIARKLRPLVEAISGTFGGRGVADALFKSAFLLVREQLVCLDDLERAGTGLNARDVLGLVSFLKEERDCKVVLLLNDKEMDDEDEFDTQLEKVADVTLGFDLTPSEAVEIALPGTSPSAALLKPRIVELGITNIRVLKKIERLSARLVELLQGFDEAVVEQAVTTLALAGWSVQQPKVAPPLEFIRGYNRVTIAMRAGSEQVDAETKRWRATIEGYPYTGTDELDELILDGAVAGYFDEDRLKEQATLIQEQRRRDGSETAFGKAWENLYHGSLATEDDEFLDAIHRSAIDEAKFISPLNINGAIRILRECGRDTQADEIIAKYIESRDHENPEFFNINNHHFSRDDDLDEALRDAFAKRHAAYVDSRTPFEVLQVLAERGGWSEADVALMAKQSADDFVQIFEELRGRRLRQSIEALLAIGRGGTTESDAIQEAATEALRRIAAKSPLRARKVARYGVKLEDPDAEAGAAAAAAD